MRRKISYATGLIATVLLCWNLHAWGTHQISPEATIFAQNLLWSMCGLAIGVLYLWRRRFATGEAKWLMTGIALVSLGTGIHRGYYTAWRWFRENGYNDIQAAQLDYAWILTIPIGMALIGYAYHARPILEKWVGHNWMVEFVSWTIILWSVAVWGLT